MTDQVLLDNDVSLKVACYLLVEQMLSITTVNGFPPAMLGVGKYVVRSKIERGDKIVDREAALAAFELLAANIMWLEPTEKEVAFAANLETAAMRNGLELDGGESQLLAILIQRACMLLITGDKRAIAALSVVAADIAGGKLYCMEQLMTRLVQVFTPETVRPRVCAEPSVDRAITASFGCSQPSAEVDDILAGLTSYIAHLESSAPAMLLHTNGLPPGDIY
ncbi:hypothetical protein [Sphingopyxis sp. C-1]|uniref:hypothetical protein n=1 Tax=Sphingopyxis sp. C-1 TaxID=262667 RepID=UPI000783438B|nr:hypothetical protein [Sphingopyxis sp. C-1]